MATVTVEKRRPQGKVVRTLRALLKMIPRRREVDGVKRISWIDVLFFIGMIIYVLNPLDFPGPVDDICVTFLESMYQYLRNRKLD